MLAPSASLAALIESSTRIGLKAQYTCSLHADTQMAIRVVRDETHSTGLQYFYWIPIVLTPSSPPQPPSPRTHISRPCLQPALKCVFLVYLLSAVQCIQPASNIKFMARPISRPNVRETCNELREFSATVWCHSIKVNIQYQYVNHAIEWGKVNWIWPVLWEVQTSSFDATAPTTSCTWTCPFCGRMLKKWSVFASNSIDQIVLCVGLGINVRQCEIVVIYSRQSYRATIEIAFHRPPLGCLLWPHMTCYLRLSIQNQ